MKKSFRIIYMGTPEFAVPSLERLAGEGHSVICAVTQPDRERGRGKKVSACPVKIRAMELGIPVFQPERIRRPDAVSFIRELAPDLLVTCAYGQILPAGLLEIPEYGCINIHASLLPKYRGAAPIQRCILNGDGMTGITTMQTDVGMDTGDILLRQEIPVPVDMTAGELHDTLKLLGADVISRTLDVLAEGNLRPVKQNDDEATYAPMLKKSESIVDWDRSGFEIHNKVRALDPWPGCFTTYGGKRMRITGSTYDMCSHEQGPGTLIKADMKGLLVACGEGTLTIKAIQFENGRRLDVKDCWHNFSEGETFGKEN